MLVRLVQGPEGSPRSSFAIYNVETGAEVQFVQSDWDYAPLASNFGWVPCECRDTDGTTPCRHKSVSVMLSEAFDFLAERDGQELDWTE